MLLLKILNNSVYFQNIVVCDEPFKRVNLHSIICLAFIRLCLFEKIDQ